MLSLNLAITRLVNTSADNFAIWVLNAPYPSGHVLHDCVWTQNLTQTWHAWQEMFANHGSLDISSLPGDLAPQPLDSILPPATGSGNSYSVRLMQHLGISLWNWVFDGPILSSLERSLGIAMGQHTRLRFQLEIRDPDLIAVPWEIMQREAGLSPISLFQPILFSRTTSEVEPLPYLSADQALNILLILGENEQKRPLQLEQEAHLLKKTLSNGVVGNNFHGYVPCTVQTLIQPTPQELIQELETNAYNVLFYAGHGLPGPDGGMLFMRQNTTLNGMELAKVLTRTGVKLAVFNACWGAQPAAIDRHAITHSSLAEVLIRQGVPAVLGMRDEITDEESHSFIQLFAQALRMRKPIDEAVALARQQLLTLYRFNRQAWTLPVLYLHPHYHGELIKSFDEGITELPESSTIGMGSVVPTALLRSLSPSGRICSLQPGITRIGRTQDNDIVIPEPSISRNHAKISWRNTLRGSTSVRTYYLQDLSTYGTTWISRSHGWEQIHRQEVALESGMQLKFGSARSMPWEFKIEESSN